MTREYTRRFRARGGASGERARPWTLQTSSGARKAQRDARPGGHAAKVDVTAVVQHAAGKNVSTPFGGWGSQAERFSCLRMRLDTASVGARRVLEGPSDASGGCRFAWFEFGRAGEPPTRKPLALLRPKARRSGRGFRLRVQVERRNTRGSDTLKIKVSPTTDLTSECTPQL
jgi:hypothetical protein